MILIRILHTSVDSILSYFDLSAIFIDSKRISTIIEDITQLKKIGVFEILLGLFTIWMSKNFFFSVMKGIRHINNEQNKHRPLWANLFNIISEIVFVIGISIAVFLTVAVRKILNSSLLDSYFSKMLLTTFEMIFRFLPEIMMFLLISFTYHFAPGTKPKWKLCFFNSFLCTVTFAIVRFFFKLFLNFYNYNMIYGVLSNLIVLLIEVSIFFYLFFFFAQNVYVNQFFNLLIISELFRLPSKDRKNKLAQLHRKLFLNSAPLLKAGLKTNVLNTDETIYNEGDESRYIYFVLHGNVKCEKDGFPPIYFDEGQAFGEREFILSKKRTSKAVCQEKTTILEIPENILTKLIKTSPDVNKKIMLSLSSR